MRSIYFFLFFPHVLFLRFSHTEDRNFMPHLHKMMTPQKYFGEIFSLNLILIQIIEAFLYACDIFCYYKRMHLLQTVPVMDYV